MQSPGFELRPPQYKKKRYLDSSLEPLVQGSGNATTSTLSALVNKTLKLKA